MLESYAVGVTLNMTSNATPVVDALIAKLERLSNAAKAGQESIATIAGGLRQIGRSGKNLDALATAMERFSRSGSGSGAAVSGMRSLVDAAHAAANAVNQASRAGGGRSGGRGRDPLAEARLNANYDNRNVDLLYGNARKMAEHENAAYDARMALIRKEADHENAVYDARMAAAKRASDAQYRNDRALAEHENARMNAAERAATRGRVTGHDLAVGGMALGQAAAPVMRGAEGAFERGMEVAHLRTQILADTRVTPAMADKMVDSAYGATASAPGTKVAENLHALIDLKNVTGSLDEAEAMLPRFARLSALLGVIDKRRGGDGAFAAAKAMEIMGGMIDERTDENGHTVREINPELMQKRLDYMARVSVATNGRVAPQDYLAFAKNARVAGMTLSDEFTYEKLPALMMAMGGQRAGTALMSMAQVFEGGKLSDKSYDALASIGLAAPGGQVARMGVDGRMHMSHTQPGIYDLETMRHDPLEWMKKAQERMEGAGIYGTENQVNALMKASQRSTIAGMFADLLKDMPAILKEQQNIQATKPDVAAHFAQNDPAAKMQQMQAAFDKLMTTLGGDAMPMAVRLMDMTTDALNGLGNWAKAHPTMATVLTDVGIGLAGVATGLGTLSAAVIAFGPALKLLRLGGLAAEAGTAAATGVGVGGRIARLAGPLGIALGIGELSRAGIDAGDRQLRNGALGPNDAVANGIRSRGAPNLRPDGTAYYHPSAYLMPQQTAPAAQRFAFNLDGRKVAEGLIPHMGRMMDGPQQGQVSFDPSMSPRFGGAAMAT